MGLGYNTGYCQGRGISCVNYMFSAFTILTYMICAVDVVVVVVVVVGIVVVVSVANAVNVVVVVVDDYGDTYLLSSLMATLTMVTSRIFKMMMMMKIKVGQNPSKCYFFRAAVHV